MDRSENMRAIHSKDTLPEMEVRNLIHRLGYRFRLHRQDLPGQIRPGVPLSAQGDIRPWMFLALSRM